MRAAAARSAPEDRERVVEELIRIERQLVHRLASLAFAPPITHVYNPLVYAREPHEEYVRRFARRGVEAVLLGMNPGPFGMAQTGVPFGEVTIVREWLGVDGRVEKPEHEHPKRPVLGFDCHRREVSGARLWGWARRVYDTPERFFARFFVVNYCPLVFMECTGRNRTPEKCSPGERGRLFAACDEALRRTIECLAPRCVVGIGRFAEERARVALEDLPVRISRVLHPSPQSPRANRGWEAACESALAACGIELP